MVSKLRAFDFTDKHIQRRNNEIGNFSCYIKPKVGVCKTTSLLLAYIKLNGLNAVTAPPQIMPLTTH